VYNIFVRGDEYLRIKDPLFFIILNYKLRVPTETERTAWQKKGKRKENFLVDNN